MTDAGAGRAAITTALARLEAVDPGAALDARAALDWLVGDDSLESLCRFGLQQFCWYELPFKWIVTPAARLEVVRGLARFFDLAGLPRYRDVCASVTTEQVLAAWAIDTTRGYDAYRSAMVASGLEPPNLPELVWSPAMEQEEFAAFWSTAMALELAVDAGVLVPGRRGWREEQLALVREHLAHPRDERFGESHLQAVGTERLAAWVEGGWGLGPRSQARRQMVAPVANALLRPVEPPRGHARALAPLSWLLDAIGGDGAGITLTERGNLPRALVQRAVEAFPRWWPGDDRLPPTREADVPELELLHLFARELRCIRRAGRDLTLTRHGREAATDPAVLWRRVADQLGTGDGFYAATLELVLVALVVDPLVDLGDLQAELLVVLTETGWHDGASGAPVPFDVLHDVLLDIESLLTLLGLVRPKGRQWDRRQLRLTEVGRATALAALRTRATAPRRP